MNTSCPMPNNPFVGLRPFESEEAELFFGRTEQTTELLQRLHRTRFLAVVGSSGCGKSSLVRAGLIPQLKAGMLVGDRDRWFIAAMKPGEHPRQHLAAALFSPLPETQTGVQETDFEESIQTSGIAAVTEILSLALNTADANLLFLVDQFEEIFRFTPENSDPQRKEEAADFVSLMLALSEKRLLPIYVVMTMRSDFLGNCDAFYGLPEALNRSQYLVPRLTRKQRREAIEGPIRLYGQSITPRLVDRVLNDMGEESDQLPVMQHAMLRVWDYWQQNPDGSLDLIHYEAKPVGTIKHALSLHAEEALEGMNNEEMKLTEKIFKALTEIDSSNRPIRRPAHLSLIEASTGASGKKILEIIERFRSGGRCFLVISHDGKSGDSLIDISHESLIRQWERLKKWVDEEAEDRYRYKRIVDAALWQHKGGGLLQDPDLQLAMDWWKKAQPTEPWAKRYGGEYYSAKKFLDASKRARRRKRIVALVITLALIAGVIGAYVLIASEREKSQFARMAVEKSKRLDKADSYRKSAFEFIKKKDYGRALGSLGQALTIYMGLGKQDRQIFTYIDIGRVHSLRRDFRQAKHFFESAQEIARSVGNREGEGQILESLASMSEQEGDLPKALALFKESLSMYRDVGNQQASGKIFEWLAIQAEKSREFEKAAQLYQSALAGYKDANDLQGYTRMENALKIVNPWGFLVDLQTTRIHDLRGPKISVGRSIPDAGVQNDISFSNRFISRHHIDIRSDGTVEDLRSRNGTTVNGRLLPYGHGAKLKDGDIITLANIKVLQFRGNRPISAPSVPAGTWAIFIDSAPTAYHYLTAPEYSLSMTGGKLAITRGFSDQAFMQLRWQNGKAQMYKVDDEWRGLFEVKETDYEYKRYSLPAGRWLELIDVPQEYCKLSADGKQITERGPSFQVVLYGERSPDN
jgi:tetratricopeptide (TPR) repeat protein/energy-coupling factor transporter ATP-binding protein EcfA2